MMQRGNSLLYSRMGETMSQTLGIRGAQRAPRRNFQRGFAGSSGQSSGKSGGFSSSSWFQWYSRKLDTHPVTTKCVSAGIISGIGNVFAQGITYHEEHIRPANEENVKTDEKVKDFEVDIFQVGRFAFLNVVLVAPVLHHWYQFINRAVPGRSMSRVLQRTFWDEFVFSPLYIPVFLGALWGLEGTSWPKIKSMLYSEVPGIVIAEWTLWVPTMIVTFRYAPVKFQVLVINTVGVVWQTFLSFMAAKAHAAQVNHEEEENPKVEMFLDSVVGPDAPHPAGDSSPSASIEATPTAVTAVTLATTARDGISVTQEK